MLFHDICEEINTIRFYIEKGQLNHWFTWIMDRYIKGS